MDSGRLLVLSDTHGNIPALKAVLQWAADNTRSGAAINTAAFLGDGLYDLSRAASAAGFFCDWKLVRGNNDHGFSEPEASCFDLGGRRFFMCHGHRYGLYSGYHTLIAAARGVQADAALFGHTHIPHLENVNGLLLVNPGSAGNPRSRIGATFAVIECSPEKPIETVFWGIDFRGKIRKTAI